MVAFAADVDWLDEPAPGAETHGGGCALECADFTTVSLRSTARTHRGCEQVEYDFAEMFIETGLYYARNRMYNAHLGRFLSRDRKGYIDGYSLYSGYMVPNYLDPSGLGLTWAWTTVTNTGHGRRLVKWFVQCRDDDRNCTKTSGSRAFNKSDAEDLLGATISDRSFAAWVDIQRRAIKQGLEGEFCSCGPKDPCAKPSSPEIERRRDAEAQEARRIRDAGGPTDNAGQPPDLPDFPTDSFVDDYWDEFVNGQAIGSMSGRDLVLTGAAGLFGAGGLAAPGIRAGILAANRAAPVIQGVFRATAAAAAAAVAAPTLSAGPSGNG